MATNCTSKMASEVIVIASLLFLFISICAGDQCPPDVLIAPCKCDASVFPSAIVCSHITEIETLHGVFEKSHDWPFYAFVLEFSNIMYIPAAAVTSKSMQKITVKNSTLTSLFDAAPARNNTVSHLNLFDVKFQRGIRWELMSNLWTLLDIKIEASEFRKLGKDFADNVGKQLRKFMMEDTKTSSLDDKAFANMKELDRIHFRHSRISELKRSMFANPSRLFVFDFRGNRIEKLPDDMFHGMERINEILLQDNLIKYFSESVFGGHLFDEVIMEIQIQDNPLICDCSIRWFVNKERYVDVEASCAGGPEDKKGLHVRQLNPKWFEYCRTRTNTLWNVID